MKMDADTDMDKDIDMDMNVDNFKNDLQKNKSAERVRLKKNSGKLHLFLAVLLCSK
jgi:hypothetical protein